MISLQFRNNYLQLCLRVGNTIFPYVFLFYFTDSYPLFYVTTNAV